MSGDGGDAVLLTLLVFADEADEAEQCNEYANNFGPCVGFPVHGNLYAR